MGKHTEGPWEFDQDNGEYPQWVRGAGGEVISGCGCCGSPNLGIDDAQLIAAAPDLLEALECVSQEHDLMRWMKNIEQRRSRGSFGIAVSDDSDAIGWQEQAEKLKVLVLRREAAIAKARGEA